MLSALSFASSSNGLPGYVEQALEVVDADDDDGGDRPFREFFFMRGTTGQPAIDSKILDSFDGINQWRRDARLDKRRKKERDRIRKLRKEASELRKYQIEANEKKIAAKLQQRDNMDEGQLASAAKAALDERQARIEAKIAAAAVAAVSAPSDILAACTDEEKVVQGGGDKTGDLDTSVNIGSSGGATRDQLVADILDRAIFRKDRQNTHYVLAQAGKQQQWRVQIVTAKRKFGETKDGLHRRMAEELLDLCEEMGVSWDTVCVTKT